MINQTSSSPPLPHNAGGQAKELDMQDGMQLDVGQELARLKRTLQDAQRRIMFRAEVATVKNCRKLVRHSMCSWTVLGGGGKDVPPVA